ncbi:MAG: MauE/DoxX family redox-associated membrane protein [Bacteroidota bacterium]
MTKEYTITGMTCNGCVAKVKETLEKVSGINDVEVQLSYPYAKIEADKELDLEQINKLLQDKGRYVITEDHIEKKLPPMPTIGKNDIAFKDLPEKSIATYKPLILILAFIMGVSALAQYNLTDFSWMTWMRHFMAGFFLVFSFFKLLNIRGFASSYAMYDLLAAKWKSWGFIYPFVELALGIAYLINYEPVITNWITLVVLGFSSIGVIKSNLGKRKIKCACLGDVFNLPMSTVTIVEDLTMVGMAVLMLLV